MKFSCEKAALATAVSITYSVASVKSAVPTLEGLLISADEDVTLTGYDMRTGIISELKADVTEQGRVVINAKLLLEIVRKLPDDIVFFTVDENLSVNIVCGFADFNILGMPADEYPDLPKVDYQNSIYIQEKILKAMIAETIFAVSENEARPIHTGALFEIDSDQITVVAVDGYRLALRRDTLTGNEIGKTEFVVPGSALGDVSRIASDNKEDNIKITVGSKHIMFTIGTNILITRRLEGEFLNYRKAIPQTSKYNIKIDRKKFINIIERVSLMIDDRLKCPVRCVFGNNKVTVSVSTARGNAKDECDTDGNAEELEIGFNSRYILDSLKAISDDTISVLMLTGISPCVIVPIDGNKNYLHMILPVRLRSNEI